MKIARLAAATAVAALMVAGAASANTLKLTGWSAGSGQSVSVNSPVKNGGVNAGAFNVTDTNPGTLGSFIAFCLDLAATVDLPGGPYNYAVTNTPFSNSSMATGAVNRIQAIFDSSYSTAVATASAVTSAGFQVALWNAVYDNDWTVASGSFKASNNTSVTAQANAYLLAASTYGGAQNWDLTYLESTDTNPRHQNLVTASPVPLPAAGLMLLGALGGLVGLRRRRKAA